MDLRPDSPAVPVVVPDADDTTTSSSSEARTSPAGRSDLPPYEPVGRDALELLDEDALRRLLATQPVIEQAKGLLMGCYRLDPDQAFALLRRWSSAGNVKVRDLARQLVEAAATPARGPFHPSELAARGSLAVQPANPDTGRGASDAPAGTSA